MGKERKELDGKGRCIGNGKKRLERRGKRKKRNKFV